MSWKGESEPNIKYCLGRTVGLVQRFTTTQNLDTIDGEPMEFEWNIFPPFTTLQLVDEVQKFINKMIDPDGQGDGSQRHVRNRRRRTREGPEPACVQTPFPRRWHTQGEKDELTSCRGTVLSAWQKPPVRRKGGRDGLPAKGKWPPRGMGTTVLTYPGSARRYQARLVKTVKIQVRWAAPHPRQDPRLPGVVTHSRLKRATSVRPRVGIVLEDGSKVAIDWVTGRSYSSARRRLHVQSGQRKGRKGAAVPNPSVAVRDRGH